MSRYGDANTTEVINKGETPEGTFIFGIVDYFIRVSKNKKNNTKGREYLIMEGRILKDCNPTVDKVIPPGGKMGVSKGVESNGFYITYKPILAALYGIKDANEITADHFQFAEDNKELVIGNFLQVTTVSGVTDDGYSYMQYNDPVLIDDEKVGLALESKQGEQLRRFFPEGTRTKQGLPSLADSFAAAQGD